MKKQNITTEEFIKRVKQTHGERYDYTNTIYRGRAKKFSIMCRIHGPFEQLPQNHLRGAGCPVCASEKVGDRHRCTGNEFIIKAKKVHGEKYIYNPLDYVDSRIPMVIICPIHGAFKQPPKEHLRYGCNQCGHKLTAEKKRITTKQFIENARVVHGNYYDYSKSIYVATLTPLIIICPIHGEFKQKPNYHVNAKTGCPSCIQSHNERIIYDKLKKNNIEFVPEYAVYLPSRKRPLRFDFFLPKQNLLIEYDGEHHYRPVKFNGISDEQAMKIYLNTKKRDIVKNNYAKEKGIRLLRIPFTDMNKIDEILNTVF